MCGIVGLGDFRPQAGKYEHNLFAQFMVGNALRGTDSSGIMKVYVDGESSWMKQVGYPYHLWESKGFDKFWTDYTKNQVRFLVGHCRASTIGESTTKNAHPFTEGHITLVHNGTLQPHLTDLPDFDKFPVDSRAIAHSIAVQGIQKTVDGMVGAYALVWWDKEKKTLNFIRNYERPMFMGIQEGMGRIIFGSEDKMLDWIMDRNNMIGPQFKEIPINTHIAFSLDSLKPTIKTVSKSFKSYASNFFENRSGKASCCVGGVWYDSWQDYEDELEKRAKDRHPKVTPTQDVQDYSQLSLPAPKEETATGQEKPTQFSFPKSKKDKKKQGAGKQTATKVGGETTKFCHLALLSTGGGGHTSVSNLFGHKQDDRLRVQLDDYEKVTEKTDRFLVRAIPEDIENTDVFFYISGKTGVDGMLEAAFTTVRITSMLQNVNPKGRHRIWAADPIPHYGSPETITPNSDEEIAEIIAEFRKEADSLVDHRDPALGD